MELTNEKNNRKSERVERVRAFIEQTIKNREIEYSLHKKQYRPIGFENSKYGKFGYNPHPKKYNY